MSRKYCKMSYSLCPATLAFQGLTVRVFVPKKNVLRPGKWTSQKPGAAPVCQSRKNLMGDSLCAMVMGKETGPERFRDLPKVTQ